MFPCSILVLHIYVLNFNSQSSSIHTLQILRFKEEIHNIVQPYFCGLQDSISLASCFFT
uniref:Uncharacterized protein n=1 Tax=Aegilops tauschii subsp. strangulata TaxID=200361 RepID=A0A452Y956_AEGTS